MYGIKNKVQLIGNLGADPEIKTTQNGKKMARFSIATSESYRNKEGEKITDTQWHNVVAWGKVAEIAENYLVKGKQCAVEGRLMHNSYEKDGVKKYYTEVHINELLLLGSKNSSESLVTEEKSALPF